MLKKISPLALLTFLCSCGAGSGGTTVVTPTDTISSTALVRFHPSRAVVEVLQTGPDPQSDNPDLTTCNFSMDAIRGDLPYALTDDSSNLQLGSSSFGYKRPLANPQTLSGVPDRVFSVWSTPDLVKEGVTVAFELEVQPELLTFRLTCTG